MSLCFPAKDTKTQMSAQNVKCPRSRVCHSISSVCFFFFFLLNCWCEEGEGEEREVRDGARWQDMEAM